MLKKLSVSRKAVLKFLSFRTLLERVKRSINIRYRKRRSSFSIFKRFLGNKGFPKNCKKYFYKIFEGVHIILTKRYFSLLEGGGGSKLSTGVRQLRINSNYSHAKMEPNTFLNIKIGMKFLLFSANALFEIL